MNISVPTKTSKSYFERALYLNEQAHEIKKRDIEAHPRVFEQLENDIRALEELGVYVNPALDQIYQGRGVFRLTIPALTPETQVKIHALLLERGFDPTPDYADDFRTLKRDTIYITVTIDPVKSLKHTKG